MKPADPPELPKLPIKVTKKLNSLTFQYAQNKGTFAIEDGTVDLIAIDGWISDVLFQIHEKVQLQKRLLGKG